MTFKLAVLEQVEKGETTFKLAQGRYGIQRYLVINLKD